MLRARIFTAIVLVAVLLLVLLVLPPMAATLAVALAVLAGAWEWSGFLGLVQRVPRLAYVGLVGLVGALALLTTELLVDPRPVLWTALAWWALAFVWVLRFPRPIGRQVAALCGFAVLLPLWLVLALLVTRPGDGPLLVLLLLVIVWAADIGAYFAGRAFGRVKLAPQVSPGKTWEGVLGGLVAALLVAAAGAQALSLPVVGMLLLTPALVMISVLGDLTVSMFKRNAGLKDSGRLLPGHGGILDRVDSLSAAAPLFLLGLGWLGAG
ncbi:MAG: phosphatidate cytidylyltransferase [Gammaproteobacteria bacterium]|nr:phosphatidate cytidylyltransferase [Gammaproteobacteria bacterium]TVQ43554.1 MAG: phosphatidate cytidylyltransferase [Gammaproteobacteria bacterium]